MSNIATLFYKKGQFSKTAYLLIVWLHIIFVKFVLAGCTLPYLGTMSNEFPKGWTDVTQMLVMLYLGTHNVSLHFGNQPAGTLIQNVIKNVTSAKKDEEDSAFPKGKEGI